MSDSKMPARKTPPSLPTRQHFPASPPQDYLQQPYSPIDGSQNIPPPVYSPLPSIDSFDVSGPVIGPDGHPSSSDVFSGDNMSSSTLGEEREDVGPGLQPPPVYTEKYGELDINQDGMETRAQISGLSRKYPPGVIFTDFLIQRMAESTSASTKSQIIFPRSLHPQCGASYNWLKQQ